MLELPCYSGLEVVLVRRGLSGGSQRGSNVDLYPWLDYARALRSPARSLLAGMILAALTVFIAIIAFWLVLWFGRHADTNSLGRVSIVVAGALVIFVCAAYAWTTARRIMQPDGFKVLRHDRRPPVVFLRSFVEDARRSLAVPMKEIQKNDPSFYLATRAGHEIRVAGVLRRIGPVVAIGRPREQIAALGAARLYVAEEHWQTVVNSLVARAAVIVLQPGATPGTSWEVNLVASKCDLRRVLLMVPDPEARPLAYAKVREMTNGVIPRPLPENPGQCEAFRFDNTFTPQALRLRSRAALDSFVRDILALGAVRS